VVGIGLNVALREGDFPPELRGSAGTLGLDPQAIGPTLDRLLEALEQWIPASPESVLEAFRARDALLGQRVRWAGGEGQGAGVDGDGRLAVVTAQGRVTLDAGEVHLATG
jgi:biotin-(acetyl-CoA carboxylase) ligase